MRKGIELPKETIEAMLNGASMFIVPIDFSDRIKLSEDMGTNMLYQDYLDKYLEVHSLLQIGDEFYVQEDFVLCLEIYYRNSDENGMDLDECWNPASQMTYKQSRLKDLTIVNVTIKSLKDLTVYEKEDICVFERNEVVSFKDWYSKQYGNHGKNQYVFLYTVVKK